jgi:hypothetical protein
VGWLIIHLLAPRLERAPIPSVAPSLVPREATSL